MINKIYIGDGVYADYDGYNIILTTENGYEATNTIVLEPVVYRSLVEYEKRLWKGISTEKEVEQ